MCVPTVIERYVVLLAELAPHFRFGRRVRIVPQTDAEPPVDDAAADAIRTRIPALEHRDRMTERLGMRPERDLIQVPEARLVVVRIRHLVQLVPVDELLQRFALCASAFHVRDEPVFERDLPPRIETAVPLGARDDAVAPCDPLSRQPPFLKRRRAD